MFSVPLHNRLTDWRQKWGMPALIAACILLQPIGTSANLPMILLAFIGLAQFVRDPLSLSRQTEFRTLIALFACLWLPMALALPDAVDFGQSAQTVFVFLLFPFMGLAILRSLDGPGQLARILFLVGGMLAFWSLDGLLQAYSGTNLFGYPLLHGQITGVFFPKHTLAVVLAVLSPVFLLWLYGQAQRRPWIWLLAPAYVLTILLAGKRSAWIMLGAALTIGVVVLLPRLSLRRRLLALGLIGLLGLAGAWGASQSPHFRAKVDTTLGLFSTDFERADKATSYRLTIWRVAGDIYADHWLNGIGPRGFRIIYPEYARPGDIFMEMNPTSGPTHPHQIVIEIGVETGAIGLFGFLLLWLWLARELWRAAQARAGPYLAWLAALGVALLPLNAGNALYAASFWGGITFWLMFMALGQRPRELATRS